ncbi:MAG: T9SS type A sorting domain-containing protein [Lewinella sp.]
MLCALFFSIDVLGQACPARTTPGSTVSVWDWRQNQFDFYLDEGFESVISPFYVEPFNIQPNTSFLSLQNNAPDYDPADGWELLYRNFGTADRSVSTGSFGLYNRYTGLVRVLFYLENNEEAFNVASIRGQHLGSPFTQGSAVFSYSSDVIPAVEDYIPNESDGFSQFNVMQRQGVWAVIDFPSAFDPCVCNSLSMMTFTPTLQSISEINLIIEGTSETVPVYDSGSGNTSELLSTSARISEGIFKGLKRYKDYNDFQEKAIKKLKFLSNFEFLPVVGSVLETLNFFINGKKTSPVVIGYNTNYSLDVTGTQTFTLDDSQVGYLTPGSQIPSSSSNLGLYTTVYDNPLGIFALLNKPVVRFAESNNSSGIYYNCDEEQSIIRTYNLDASSINYIINTAAGLEAQPVSIQAALRFGDCDEGIGSDYYQIDEGDFAESIGLTVDEDGFYNTPLLNLDCLEDYTVRTEYDYSSQFNSQWGECETEDEGAYCDDVKLVILVAIERTDGGVDEEIILTLTYDVELEEASYSVNQAPENPYLGMDIEDINATCTNIPAPVSNSELVDFCDNVYNPALLSTRSNFDNNYDLSFLDNYVQPKGPSGPKDPKDRDISIYSSSKLFNSGDGTTNAISTQMSVSPNPSSGLINITPPRTAIKTGTLSVLSVDGKLMTSTRVSLTDNISADLSSLKPGLYILVLQDTQGNTLGTERHIIK